MEAIRTTGRRLSSGSPKFTAVGTLTEPRKSLLVSHDATPSKPLLIRPKGVSDAQDAPCLCWSNAGAHQSCSITYDRWPFIPRPAATQLTDFSSSHLLLVSRRYAASVAVVRHDLVRLHAGFDQPFIYDLVAGAFVNDLGHIRSNLPATLRRLGLDTPVIVAITATKIIVTHAALTVGQNFFA